MEQWIDAHHQLPPRPQGNSHHSRYCLTAYFKKTDIDSINSGNGYLMLLSAYYDFDKKIWTNDYLKKGDSQLVSHWMPLPAEFGAEWTSAADTDAVPPIQSDNLGTRVLIRLSGLPYEASLIQGTFLSDELKWMPLGLYEPPYFPHADITAWRPLPVIEITAPAAAQTNAAPKSEGGFFKKLFGR